MRLRNAWRLRTLAEALDSLSEVKLERVGDLLIQRFKAVELAVQVGNWNVASGLGLATVGSVAPQRQTFCEKDA